MLYQNWNSVLIHLLNARKNSKYYGKISASITPLRFYQLPSFSCLHLKIWKWSAELEFAEVSVLELFRRFCPFSFRCNPNRWCQPQVQDLIQKTEQGQLRSNYQLVKLIAEILPAAKKGHIGPRNFPKFEFIFNLGLPNFKNCDFLRNTLFSRKNFQMCFHKSFLKYQNQKQVISRDYFFVQYFHGKFLSAYFKVCRTQILVSRDFFKYLRICGFR